LTAARPDRLGQAGALFLGLWAAAAAVLAVLVLGASLRWTLHPDPRPALVRALGISSFAANPSGRAPRSPVHPAVDLRFSPYLPDTTRGQGAFP
jgi:hypothetical protein